MHRSAEKACTNVMWQLGFKRKGKGNTQKNCLKEILRKQAENCCIKKEEKIFKILYFQNNDCF